MDGAKFDTPPSIRDDQIGDSRRAKERSHRVHVRGSGWGSPLSLEVRFCLGKIVATRAAFEAIDLDELVQGVVRHARGDWGEVPLEDRLANHEALTTEGRLFSAYTTANGQRFWIITEADRSATTLLLPEDY